MSDSSTTLVPKRIFIEPAEREQMEKRITSWMIEKVWFRKGYSSNRRNGNRWKKESPRG